MPLAPLERNLDKLYYKFLLFDLDHTLLDFDAAEETALQQLFVQYGAEDIEAHKAAYRTINRQLWRDLELGLVTKKELVETRFARTFAYFGRIVDGLELAEFYEQHLSKQGQSFSGAADLLHGLKEKGYQLYGATNGITKIQEGRLAHSDIAPFFKKVFISELLGTQKPHALFYEKIAEQIAGFIPERALMIGDSLTADIQGGNNAGIDTVWYNPDSKENHTEAKPTYTISRLTDLLAILELDLTNS